MSQKTIQALEKRNQLGKLETLLDKGPAGQDEVRSLVTDVLTALEAERKRTAALLEALKSAKHENRRHRSLARSADIAHSDHASVQQLVSSVTGLLQTILGADHVAVYFVGREDLFAIKPEDLTEETWLHNRRILLGKGIEGRVATSGTSVLLKNTDQDPRFEMPDSKCEYEIHSLLSCPVMDGHGKVFAVISCFNKIASTREASSSLTLIRGPTHHARFNTLPDASPNSDPLPTFCHFDASDLNILESIAISLQSVFAKHHAGAQAVGLQDSRQSAALQSFVDMYSSSPLKGSLTRNRAVSYAWPRASRATIDRLSSLEFSVFDCDEQRLRRTVLTIFQQAGLVDQFNLPLTQLQSFVSLVHKNYHDNPFHNFKHAWSVMQFMFWMLCHTGASNYLLPLDVLGLLVAALCHDIDHPGHTNDFEKNMPTKRALLYNDISVLENHHSAVLFYLLRKKETNFISHLPRDDQRALRQRMIGAILATDMKQHSEELKMLQEIKGVDQPLPQIPFEQRPMSPGRRPLLDYSKLPFDPARDGDRERLCKLLLHTADLSGQVYPLPVAKEWEIRISKEFANQAEMEEKKGLPVAPFMKNLSDPRNRARQQTNFVDFVLMPWWGGMARVFPELEVCLRQLQTNRNYYHSIATQRPPPEQ